MRPSEAIEVKQHDLGVLDLSRGHQDSARRVNGSRRPDDKGWCNRIRWNLYGLEIERRSRRTERRDLDGVHNRLDPERGKHLNRLCVLAGTSWVRDGCLVA